MGDISFAGTFLKKGQLASTQSRASAARERNAAVGERNQDANARSFERSASIRVGNVLAQFGGFHSAQRYDLQNEAEGLEDILNLNPGLVAGAQIFYIRTHNEFSPELFKQFAPDILSELVEMDGLVPAHQTMARDTDPNVYASSLLRYVLRIGSSRGVDGLPPAIS